MAVAPEGAGERRGVSADGRPVGVGVAAVHAAAVVGVKVQVGGEFVAGAAAGRAAQAADGVGKGGGMHGPVAGAYGTLLPVAVQVPAHGVQLGQRGNFKQPVAIAVVVDGDVHPVAGLDRGQGVGQSERRRRVVHTRVVVGISSGQGVGGHGNAVGVGVSIDDHIAEVQGRAVVGGFVREADGARAAADNDGQGRAGVGFDRFGEGHLHGDSVGGVVSVIRPGDAGNADAGDSQGIGGSRPRPGQQRAEQDGGQQQGPGDAAARRGIIPPLRPRTFELWRCLWVLALASPPSRSGCSAVLVVTLHRDGHFSTKAGALGTGALPNPDNRQSVWRRPSSPRPQD